jgi:hypothetical protein
MLSWSVWTEQTLDGSANQQFFTIIHVLPIIHVDSLCRTNTRLLPFCIASHGQKDEAENACYFAFQFFDKQVFALDARETWAALSLWFIWTT